MNQVFFYFFFVFSLSSLANGSAPPEELYSIPGNYELVSCNDDQLNVDTLVVTYDLEEFDLTIKDGLEGSSRHFHNVFLELEDINGDYQREKVDGALLDEKSKSEGNGVFKEYGRECSGWGIFTKCTDWEPIFEVQFVSAQLRIKKWRRFGKPKDVDCVFKKITA